MHLSRNVIALFAITAVHCNSTPDTPKPKYPDAASYCNGRATAECSDAVVAACAVSSKDICVAKRSIVCLNVEVPTGKVYDSSKAEACVNKVSAAYADAKLTKDEIDTYTAACGLLFSGTGIKDANCSVDTDCEQSEGLACVLRPTASAVDAGGDAAGTCQVPVPGKAGDSCADANVQCADGYHCDPTVQYCVVNRAVNQTCSAAIPCIATLKCSTAGTCEPTLATGACAANADCTSGICNANLCVAQVIFAQSEQFCVDLRN
jgi:hypothetical protein